MKLVIVLLNITIFWLIKNFIQQNEKISYSPISQFLIYTLPHFNRRLQWS